MVDNGASEVSTSSYETNPIISEAVSNILHSSDLTSLSALVHQSDGKRAKEHRVKRPMNAFMLYAQVARRKVATKYPNLNYATLSKTLGKIWQVLPEEERRPFIQEAERLRTQHKLKHPDYKYTPKRLGKDKKSQGSSAKKIQYENLKPEELLSILQTKPSTFQGSVNPGDVAMRNLSMTRSSDKLPLNLPLCYNDPLGVSQSFSTDTQSSESLSSLRSLFDSDIPALDYLENPNRAFNRTAVDFSCSPGNDLRWLFSDQFSRTSYPNVNQFLDSFTNPNLFTSQKPSSLPAHQTLPFFPGQESSAFASHGPINHCADNMDLSQFSTLKPKIVDPMENINNFLEGKPHLSNYLTV